MERRAGRVPHDQGFSLADLLVTMALIGMMGAAIFWVYEVGSRTYVQASSQEDAQLGARAGMDQLATELRLIGAYWSGATGAGAAITVATASTITFVGDVDAETVVGGAETTVSSGTSAGTTAVVVTGTATQAAAAFNADKYLYVANGAVQEVAKIASVSGTTLTLVTPLTNTYPAGSIVRSIEPVTYRFDPAAGTLSRTVGGGAATPIVENVLALTLTYYDGANPPAATTLPSAIREIAMSLTAQGRDGSRRTFTSRVRPRNLNLP